MSEVGWIGLSIRGTSWRTVMFVALAYFTAGLAAELLAVPPGGHALPLWPAAGLALAALLVCGFRCWPGIWIGSLLYSLWLDVSLAGVTAGVLESTGAVLQALFGAWLTRRYFTIPIPLARESHVLRFLFFGGPVACVVAASVGVLVLVGFRDVPPSDAMAQWFTWWGGDTLGVLLFTPLFLLAWPGWRRLWVGGGPRVALPLLIITALLTGGHFALDRLERDRTRAAAEEQMDEVYRAGILPFATVIESLNGVERFFSSSVEVTRREFANYVRGITRHPEVLAVDWAPRVPRERLSAVEALAGAEGVDAYRVFELDADGRPVPRGERDDYFPVFYSEPAASNAVALGLDHGFEAPRREAMALARDRGTAAATAITPLLRTDQQVNLVFVPVYRPHLNAEQADVAARHEALLGFVVGVLDLRSLFDPLVSAARTRRLALRITDVTPGDPPQLLLDSLPDGVGADWSREAVVVGRLVRLEMSPATDFLRPGASTEAQIFVGFSLLAAFLASFAALSAAGRAAATEAEVAARTNELREREQDLDITLRSIGDAVLATDPQGRVTRMNPIAEHLTGWSLDEARGRVVDEVLHIINEQTRERALMPVEQVLRTGEMQGLANHTLLIARDGSERAIADSAAPIRTVDGHLRGVVLVFRDVTRERAAEAQFSRFFEMSLDMLCIASADGYFKRVNQTFSRTLGWSVDEMLARPILDFVHPDDREATRHEIDRQVRAGESVMHFENRYRYKYGGWRVLSWRSIPQDGGLMFATARDVTQRNKAEHEIHRLNADLERQVQERTRALEDLNNKEQEIRAVVDNLLDCVITIDAQGIVQNVNPMLTKIFGYAPDEIVGQNVSMLMPEPHRGQHDGYLARYLETGEVHVIGVGREVEGRHRSGRLIPLELSVNEYEMRGQRMFIGTLRDIHERKRLIADLTRARLEAEQANRAKSAFLATMSHEIRTPMNGVIGMVDVLAHSRLSEYQADLVHTIRESASTLLSLIDDILDFSKIEAGKLEIEHVPVSVADLVEGLCNSMVTVAARRGVDLFLFVSPAIPERVLSDDVRLRQMLYNLIGNAIKFSSGRTGKRGRVSVRAEVAQTDPLQLSFAIADNGIGMTPATVDQLFTPFTQAEVSTTRRYGGTGLGLTICKRLVDMMQGGIAVASEPGEGSTFTVTLPFDVPAEQPVRELPDLGGIDCILVENRELDVGGLRIYLEHAGAKVRQVSGEDAIGPLAAQMSGPVVAIRFVAQERTGQERTAQEAIDFPLPNLGYLLISRGRRRRARVQAPGVVSLDGDALRRQALLRAVAVAAGRASPEVFHDDAREALPGEDLTPPSITDARAKGRLILVAEDDEINQKVILRQLALLGYAAEVAGNGREALRLLEDGGYALLLTDLHMPEMDGYTLTEAIRRKEQGGRRMPILALTANALRGEANRATAVGMDEYLTKPVTLPNLKAALDKWMPPEHGASTMVEEQPVNNAKPVLDVSVLKGLVGDDMGVVTEFLADFLESARRHAADLRAAETAGDVMQLTSIAHKLKSSSRSVGALMFGDLCAGLESAGKSGDKLSIAQGMAALEQAFAEVEVEINRILGAS